MGIIIKNNIVNQKGNPAWYEDTLANRPTANLQGRMFVDTDNPSTGIYRDTGSSWVAVADPGAGTTGTLQQVTTNGSTTNVGISITTLTPGSILFSGTGGLISQDNTNLFWDDANNFLGIGPTGGPSALLDIHSATQNIFIQVNATSTNNSNIAFLNGGVGKWRIGNVYNAGANDFNIYDTTNATTRINLTNAGVLTLTGNEVINKTLTTITSASSLDTSVSYTPTTTITDVNSYGFISRYKLNLTNGLYNSTTTTNATGIFSFLNIDGNNGSISTQPIRGITSAFSVTTAAIKLQDYRSIQINTLESVSVTGNTITNAYGLYISQLKGSTNFTVTNGWGIYQTGANDNNYFASKILIGSTTDNGNLLQVNGDINGRNIFARDGYGFNAGDFQIGGITSGRLYFYNNVLGIDNITIIPSTGVTTFARSIAIGNTVTASVINTVTNKVSIIIGGVQYYLLASTSAI
jgi:hypothetical protein